MVAPEATRRRRQRRSIVSGVRCHIARDRVAFTSRDTCNRRTRIDEIVRADHGRHVNKRRRNGRAIRAVNRHDVPIAVHLKGIVSVRHPHDHALVFRCNDIVRAVTFGKPRNHNCLSNRPVIVMDRDGMPRFIANAAWRRRDRAMVGNKRPTRHHHARAYTIGAVADILRRGSATLRLDRTATDRNRPAVRA